jgi:cell division protease FtsH
MVTELGMSDAIGPVHYGSEDGEVFLGRNISSGADRSEKMSALIDDEVHSIITEAYERAKSILRENIDKLHFIADFLVKHETMDGEQFIRVMDGEPTIEELEDMVADKKRRSEEENRIRAEHIKKREAEREAARAAEEKKKAERARNDMPPFNGNPGGQGHFGPPPTDPTNGNDSDNGEDK